MTTHVGILLRHAESGKNVAGAFSDEKDYGLTNKGRVELESFTEAFVGQIENTKRQVRLFSSPSTRSLETAEVLGRRLKLPISLIKFRSIHLGDASFLTEVGVAREFPKFSHELALYRSGLFNSYSMTYPVGSEDPRHFENEMYSLFRENLVHDNATLSIFVMHRSPMTAILLNALRSEQKYPQDFYGHVAIDHLKPFVIVGISNASILYSMGMPLALPD